MDPLTGAAAIGTAIGTAGLSKPMTLLIEKISEALGGTFRPRQIRRIAKADADAAMTLALSKIEIGEIEQRALRRVAMEETRRQENMESIAAKALPLLGEEAKPDDVSEDWIANFFDKCRITSEEEMQALWARVLAGEANAPGRFSKRTVDLLSSLDKSDAALFSQLCGYVWTLGASNPIILDIEHELYSGHGITFESLTHLDEIGLVSFSPITGYQRRGIGKAIVVGYFDERFLMEFPDEVGNSIPIGKALFSKAGRELSQVCTPTKVPGFKEYLIEIWSKKGISLHGLPSFVVQALER